MKKQVKVLVRTDSNGDVILFFPNSAANYGSVECWQYVGQHGEASVEYLKECKTVMDDTIAKAAISNYVGSYPADDSVEYVLAKRLQMTDLQNSWSK